MTRKVDQLKGRLVAGLHALQHHADRSFGALEGKALRFQRLDLRQRFPGLVGADLQTELARFIQHVAPSGKLGDHRAPLVAHQRRVDMLVAGLVLQHGSHVDAAFMGKSAGANIG